MRRSADASAIMAPMRRPTAPGSGHILWLLLAVAVGLAACEAGLLPTRAPGTVTAPPGPERPVERARVVRVVDGDTIVVRVAGRWDRVRYIGIDAPESVRPDVPVQAYGRESTAANADLVAGREVLLERDVSDRDRFGRLLRYVWVESDEGLRFVNFDLVLAGYATAVTFPPDVRHADLLRLAERSARIQLLGLWSVPASPSAGADPGD